MKETQSPTKSRQKPSAGSFWGTSWLVLSIIIGVVVPQFNPSVDYGTSILISVLVGFVTSCGISIGIAYQPPPPGKRAVVGAITGTIQGAATGYLLAYKQPPNSEVSMKTGMVGMAVVGAITTAVIAAIFWRSYGDSERVGVKANQCEVCGRRMQKIQAGKGYVMVFAEERVTGAGTAEECWECGRLYCDQCYPSRPPNTCVCGKGREAVRNIGGVVYKGSLRLIKVRYLP